MPTKTASAVHRKAAAEVRSIAINFQPELDSGEVLSGTPTIVASPASGAPTFSSVAKNSAVKVIEGVSVSANQAVTALVSGGTAGQTYTLAVTCATDLGQTIIVYVTLQVENS